MSTFRWSNSTDRTERIATVAFDPNGTGKDEYIADLVTGKSWHGFTCMTNKDRRVSKVVPAGDGNDLLSTSRNEILPDRTMLCLTAGDFNGDGKDT